MIVIEPPKTESSIRKVYIPLFIVALLKKYKDNSDKYILSGKTKPTEPRALQYRFKRILSKTKIRELSFHSLRHPKIFCVKVKSSNQTKACKASEL